MKKLILILLFLSGCSDRESVPTVEEPVVKSYFISVDVNGLSGTIIIKNEDEFLSISDDGNYLFENELLINDDYDVTIDSFPEGQVCAVNYSSGNYETILKQNVHVKCMPNMLSLKGSAYGLSDGQEISFNTSNIANERIHQLLFSDADLLDFYDTAMESISTVAGLFVKDSGINAYYGVTRSGDYCRLFRYNLNTRKIDLIKEIRSSAGSWSIKRSGDNLYIGTYNSPSIYKFNLFSNDMLLLAEIPGEQYIWDLIEKDGVIYIGTYPSAKLFSLNIENKELVDLGMMSERGEAKYIRSLASNNQKIYTGLGTHAELIEYDILSKVKTQIPLPENNQDSFVYQLKVHSNLLFIGLSPSTDVLVYDLDAKQYIYYLKDIITQPISQPTFNSETFQFSFRGYVLEYEQSENVLRRISLDFGVEPHFINETEIASVNENGLYFEATYQGKRTTEVDFLNSGLKGIPALPYSMTSYQCKVFIGERRLRTIDLKYSESFYNLIFGEPKAMSVLGGELYTANYTGAQIWKYPMHLFEKGKAQSLDDESYLFLELGNNQNRPLSMDSNKNSLIIGTEPHYGTYGGAFTVITPSINERFTGVNVVESHSVSSVTFDRDDNNIVYVGTSDRGGTGSTPLNESAYFVKWNLIEQTEIFRINPDESSHKIIKIISIEDSDSILVLTEGGMIILIDKSTGEFKKKSEKVYREIMYSKDGNIYSIDENSIYRIDRLTLKESLLVDGFSNLSFLIEDAVTGNIFVIDDYNLYSLFSSTQLCDF